MTSSPCCVLPPVPFIDDALDTLYELTAVFNQFLGFASSSIMVFFPFLSLLPLLVLSFLFFYLFFPLA